MRQNITFPYVFMISGTQVWYSRVAHIWRRRFALQYLSICYENYCKTIPRSYSTLRFFLVYIKQLYFICILLCCDDLWPQIFFSSTYLHAAYKYTYYYIITHRYCKSKNIHLHIIITGQ